MIITLVGTEADLSALTEMVHRSLSELALDDSVTVKTTNDEAYKMELGITTLPALAIEEETIDFKDVIFQGETPDYDEIKSMFLSILGDDDIEGCGCNSGACGSCETGC